VQFKRVLVLSGGLVGGLRLLGPLVYYTVILCPGAILLKSQKLYSLYTLKLKIEVLPLGLYDSRFGAFIPESGIWLQF